MLNFFLINILVIIILFPSIILYICLKYLGKKFNFDFKIIGPFSYTNILFNYENDLFSLNFKIDKFSLNLIWLKFRFIIKGFKIFVKLKENENENEKEKEKPIDLFYEKDKLINNSNKSNNFNNFNKQDKKGIILSY